MLAHKTLVQLLQADPLADPNFSIPTKFPFVSYAYIKHVWKQDQKVSNCGWRL